MNKQTLNEATLMAPVFTGSDDEVAAATQSWSSIISSLSYAVGQSLSVSGTTQMSVENKRAMFVALQCYLDSKVAEINNVTVPPTPTVGFSAPTPCPPVAELPPEEASYAESQKPVKESVSPMVKRMRELAGIPHEGNRV